MSVIGDPPPPESRRASAVRLLHSWRFWMVIAYFAIVCVGAWQYKQVQRTASDEAAARAKIQAQAAATYEACVDSIPELTRLSLHLRGVNRFADTLVTNAKAVLDATTLGDSQLQVRIANLGRLRAALRDIHQAASLPVPTRIQCEQRRSSVLRQG